MASLEELKKKYLKKDEDDEKEKKSLPSTSNGNKSKSKLDELTSKYLTTSISSNDADRWLKDANDILSGFTSKTDSDYSKYRNADTTKVKKLLESSNDVWKYLRTNKEKISNYTDLYQGYNQINNALKSVIEASEFYSQFETEEAYNKWNERYTKKAKEEQDVLGSADYKEYSQKGASIENPTMKEAEGFANIFGWRPGSEDIKNIVTYSRENANELRMGAVNNSKLLGDFRYSHMTDNEVGIYNYYLAKYGEDKANEYLKSIDDELDQREAGKMAEVFDDNVFLESIMGFSAGVETSVQGLKGLADYVTGNTSGTDYSANQYADQIVASNNEGILKGIHDVSSVIGGMTPSILASTITGNPLVGATVMGDRQWAMHTTR
jgi:hypothetical protein